MSKETGSSSQEHNVINTSEDKLSLKELCDLKDSFVDAIEQNDYSKASKIAVKIRKAVSYDDNPPLEDLVTCGVIPHLIKVIDENGFDNVALLDECVWIIANLAAGTSKHVQFLIDNGIIDKALMLINHPSDNAKDNAVWILANISGDSFKARDMILEHGIVHRIEVALNGFSFLPAFLSRVAWLISNLCRGKPYPKFSEVKDFLPILQFFLLNVNDNDTKIRCIWALSYLSDGSDEQIAAIMELEICDKLVELMSSENDKLSFAALRTVGTILTGDDIFTSTMIEYGVLEPLYKLLMSPQKTLKREAAWAISNILTGTTSHIEAAINYEDGKIIKRLFELSEDQDPIISKESVIGLSNACLSESSKVIQTLDHLGVIELLVKVLEDDTNKDLVKSSLQAVENILRFGNDNFNHYAQELLQLGGFDAIENLRSHSDNEVAKLAENILAKYDVDSL